MRYFFVVKILHLIYQIYIIKFKCFMDFIFTLAWFLFPGADRAG
jgi:hypothetical protein